MFLHKRKSFFVFILLTFLMISTSSIAQDKNEEALAKSADELFQNGDFKKAKDVYSQLISLYPKNPNYNYRFGASMLFVDKDKEFPIKFLEYSITQPNVNVEAFYYMGKGYHYNFKFDKAISVYKQYLAKVSSKEKNPLPANDEIRYCQNGKGLLKDIKEPSILNKFKINRSDFYVSIKIKPMGGRVLNAPKELQSSYDKKKDYVPVMYVNTNTDEVYFSSYGSNGSTGLDIYKARVKSNGELDKPVKLSAQINTPYDESYPFMNEDETEFFFASKGHNSMGGYDIFKSNYDLDAETFSSAINLDYSINTPDDDFMYATVAKAGYSFFVSDRNCERGKVYVFKIDAEVNTVQVATLTGVFTSKTTKSCKITVTDVDKNEKVGTYSTNKTTGSYEMRLHQGGNYSFLVEAYGSQMAYKGNVKIPAGSDKDLKQEIEILEENGNERLIIRNLFGDQPIAVIDNTPEEKVEIEEVPIAVAHIPEIDDEIENTKKQIQNYIGENKKNANLSYTVANEKRELAQQDLAMAEQLEGSISLNDESAENKEKQKELNQLMMDAQKHADQAEAAFQLGTNLDALVSDAEDKLNKYEQYRVKIAAAEEFEEGEKMQKVYTDFKNDEDLFQEQKISEFLGAEINKEEQEANNYIKRAEKVSAKQVTLKSEIKAGKVRKNSTKDPDQKDAIQVDINDIESELAPLESEKERLYIKAAQHSTNAQKLINQLTTLNAYIDLGIENNQIIAEVSPEQKTALIASITATAKEIEALVEALVEASSEELKIDGPKGITEAVASNTDNTGSSLTDENDRGNENGDTEIITGGVPDDINPSNTAVGDETNLDTEETASTSTPVETPTQNSKYFAYTDEYEEPVDEVAIIEGESIPLEITSSTGKRKYTPEELKQERVKLQPSAYQNSYDAELKDAQGITDRNEKAKKLQYLNYNLVVDIEKEIAVLSYAKSVSTNNDYTELLDQKLDNLEAQSKQKRNFLILNSQVVKQLEKEEQEALLTVKEEEIKAGNEAAVIADSPTESGTTITDDAATTSEESNTSADTQEATNNLEVEDLNTELNTEEIAYNTNVESGNSPAESTNQGSKENAFNNENVEADNDNFNSSTKSNTEPPIGVNIEEVKSTPGKALITKIKTDEEVQENVVAEEKSNLTELQAKLNQTKKKKARAQIQIEIDAQTAQLKLEKEKLKITSAKIDDVSNTLDAVVSDPLATRPSVAKSVQAQKYRVELRALELELGEKEDLLSNTRKKKKKKVIVADIAEIETRIEFKKMQYEMALESAQEIEEVEVLVLKNVTNYGTEVMVELPEPTIALTNAERSETKQLAAYQEYKKEEDQFQSRIENASVMYQSAAKKQEALKNLDSTIERLTKLVVDLPEDEQPEVLAQIEEAQQERARIVREAEVFYTQAKSTTNDAYYDLNEANAELLKLTNADDRTKIIALVKGSFAEPKTAEEQEELLVFEELKSNTVEENMDVAPKSNTGVNNIDDIPRKLSVDIFVVSGNQTYYSNDNPIPQNVVLPEGVILKVQVGAFRNKISPEVFKGFAPIVAEKTGTGLTRYTAGLFTDFENANKAKASIRAKGYSDAFVVAYLNGKRITIAEARRVLSGEITADQVGNSVTKQTPPVNDVVINNVTVIETRSSATTNGRVQVESVDNRGSLFFTVQVGVYNQAINPSSVFKITPLNSDPISGGLVRYSSGIYPSVGQAVNARNNIVQQGITDAFVTAYYNGKRITVADAKRIATQNGGDRITNTPSRPGSNIDNPTPVATDEPTVTREPTITIQPIIKNGYYVEIGPYASAIPIAEARVILSLSSLGVIVVKKDDITIYRIGNFTDEIDAIALRDNLISKGLTAPEVKKGE